MKKLLLTLALIPSIAFGGTSIEIKKDQYPDVLKTQLESAGFPASFDSLTLETRKGSEPTVISCVIHFHQDLDIIQLETVNSIIADHIGPRAKMLSSMNRIQVLMGKLEADTATQKEKDELLLKVVKFIKKIMLRWSAN